MGLETVGKLVARHTGSPAAVQAKLDKAETEQAIVRSMYNWIMWGMIIIGIGIVMIVIDKSFPIASWFKLLSTLVVLSGLGVAVGGALNAIRRGTLPVRREPIQIRPPNTNELLANPNPAELPSVTERTTQLIAVEEAPTNKMMDTGPNE
jgi:hypothetical protein